jgi:hypothetical protein
MHELLLRTKKKRSPLLTSVNTLDLRTKGVDRVRADGKHNPRTDSTITQILGFSRNEGIVRMGPHE